MVSRYGNAENDFKKLSNVFYDLYNGAETYVGNLNLATGGRCTTENVGKLLAKFNYVFTNIIPILSSIIKLYTNNGNLY